MQGSKLSARRQFHLTDWLTCTPTPCFCVCAGIIGLTGEWLGCAGMIGLSGFFGAGEGVGRPEMAQEQHPLSIT